MIEHAQQIVANIGKPIRSIVIVAIAMAARVPGSRSESRREIIDLIMPVETAETIAVQEHDQLAAACDIDCDARSFSYIDGLH
jgi:hypothetical protein